MAFAATLFSSCSNDDDEMNEENSKSSIVGTWSLVHMKGEYYYWSSKPTIVDKDISPTDVEYEEYQFNEDNTFIYYYYEEELEKHIMMGAYRIKDSNTIELIFGNYSYLDSYSEDVKYSIKKNVLTMEFEDGSVGTYKRKKQ